MNLDKRKEFLSYCLPDITSSEINEVINTLKSGWLAKGPKTIEFEKRFAEYVGSKYAIGMNSATAALHISLLAAGVGPGDEVITTPMTFAASANTIIHTGAKPVFVDVDPETGCIDPDEITKNITPLTKAIVPVHYAGQACDLDTIYEISEKNNLFVSEDAAHGLYTEYKGRMIGDCPKGTVSYSFYATKNLATGEGGMLVTDNEEIANKARVLITHGMSRNAWNRYAKGGSWMYDIQEPGYKYNMFDLQAALGLKQLERLSEMQERREEIAEIYNEAFKCLDGIEIPKISEYTTNHSWHLYIVKINGEHVNISRDQFITELANRNVGTSVHFIPLHLMSAYRDRYGYKLGDFPIAEKWFENIVSLPLYPTMTNSDVQYVIDAVKDIVTRSALMKVI
ncbi:DegT/DnrJ/EryC1/StrS family aminotransferase [Paenibacillus doosanensis]|uniref:DegT/DnrJ/EryC1/StrS family aminotransferase n=1 Tax=Paenibacillus doosanensis TaxID=1229154 RepID=UPI00217F6DF4|nr:DegT/DnrJ/EryC1/StrS family aminotransferase [Paenibacillus doosanensis]MCS7459896.1 DegT/DnrJ/EryC1/StrS family aminotransferase [Paenibacillus doosanensis]